MMEDRPSDNDVQHAVRTMLLWMGEKPDREGLQRTPERFVKAWKHYTRGYEHDIESLMTTFADGAEGCDQLVVVKDLSFVSFCEHHMAPFFGTAAIGYIPRDRVIGLSKLPRLLDVFASRLQVQERMTNQIADAIDKHLNPIGVGVRIKARHTCIEFRGIQKQNSETVTCALRGALLREANARAEFLSLCNGK